MIKIRQKSAMASVKICATERQQRQKGHVFNMIENEIMGQEGLSRIPNPGVSGSNPLGGYFKSTT